MWLFYLIVIGFGDVEIVSGISSVRWLHIFTDKQTIPEVKALIISGNSGITAVKP